MRDYISREDAIMVAGDMLNSLTGISCKDGENTAREYFKCIPSTDIRENVSGEWIPHRLKSREYIGTVLVSVDYDYWFCDTCGYRVENGQPMYNYCPNCGAEMHK